MTCPNKTLILSHNFIKNSNKQYTKKKKKEH